MTSPGATIEAEVVVLVKAAPVMTRALEETMCVAGVRTDVAEPEWIRLHPVPFRDLAEESRFAKYQRVRLRLQRGHDRRPESWRPVSTSIELLSSLPTARNWAERRQLVSTLPEQSMCALVAGNRAGHGKGAASLAVIRPVGRPVLEITPRDADQVRTWSERAAAASNRLSLFEEVATAAERDPLEVVPWRFRFQYTCCEDGCRGHRQTIVDWEAAALWKKVRHDASWQQKMRDKWERDMWAGRDTVLFVGNQEEHPSSFLVLGVFWPPDRPYQPDLGLGGAA